MVHKLVQVCTFLVSSEITHTEANQVIETFDEELIPEILFMNDSTHECSVTSSSVSSNGAIFDGCAKRKILDSDSAMTSLAAYIFSKRLATYR